MRSRFTTVAAAVSLLAGLAMVTAPTAAAEGECSGSFNNLPSGSALPCDPPNNYWEDTVADSVATSLNLRNCSVNPDVTLQRWTGSTWTNLGPRRRVWCVDASAWMSWGDMPPGRYRAILTVPNPAGVVSASHFEVVW